MYLLLVILWFITELFSYFDIYHIPFLVQMYAKSSRHFLYNNKSPGVRTSLAIQYPSIRQYSEHGRNKIKFRFMGYTILKR